MKKLLKIIASGIAIVALALSSSVALAQVGGGIGTPQFLKLNGGGLSPVISSWTIGSAANPVSSGYFTNLIASSTSLTGTSTAPNFVATSPTLVNTFAGFVGIATTSPYAALSVVGQIVGSYFTATSTTATSTFASGIQITSPVGDYRVHPQLEFTSGNGLYMQATNSFLWDIGGSPAFGINGGGIYANQTNGVIVKATQPTATVPGLAFNGDLTTGIGRSGAGIMHLITSGATALTLDAGQKIGIGSTTPTALLTVQGSNDIVQSIIKANGTQTANMTEWQSSIGALIAYVSSNGTFFTNQVAPTGTGTQLTLGRTYSGTSAGAVSLTSGLTGTSGTASQFNQAPTFTTAAGSASQSVLSLTPTYNYAGAQTGTATDLLINSTETNLNGAGHNLVDVQVGGTSKFIIKNSGNTGIGTSSPGSLLTVDGSNAGIAVGVSPLFVRAQSGITANIFDVRDSTNATKVAVQSNGTLVANQGIQSNAGTGAAPQNGNIVSASTGTTQNAFVAKGIANQTGDFLRFLDGNNLYLLTVNAAGNLSVGTSTTPYKLGIQGAYGATADLFNVATTTSAGYATSSLFRISNAGHIHSMQPVAPALSSCGGGSPAIVGSDNGGTVTAGTAATGCVVTFTTPYSATPSCTVTPQTGSVTNTFSYSISTNAITVTETGLAGNKFDYMCMGN